MSVHYDKEIRINKINMGPYSNNGYIITCQDTGECVIIDAPAEANKLLNELEDDSKVRAILITHGHWDHILGYQEMKSGTGSPVGIHEADAHNLSPHVPDFHIEDGDVFQVGNIRLEQIATPGHTPGGVCLLAGRHLFCGDTLFPGGPGNASSPEDFRHLIDSITTKIFRLPEDTIVYPGHGADTTIGDAKKEYDDFAGKTHPHDLHGNVTWLSS